jgi:hypothetical protein
MIARVARPAVPSNTAVDVFEDRADAPTAYQPADHVSGQSRSCLAQRAFMAQTLKDFDDLCERTGVHRRTRIASLEILNNARVRGDQDILGDPGCDNARHGSITNRPDYRDYIGF